MKLIKIVSSNNYNHDYYADFECEYCGHKTHYVPCYDDANFDDNVIPNALCPKCNISSSGETEGQQQARLGRVYRHYRGLRDK
jgi:hypothetical protein